MGAGWYTGAEKQYSIIFDTCPRYSLYFDEHQTLYFH
jgi:hypothetical protein